MDSLIVKYADKLVKQGLCDPGAPLIGGLDAALTWNRDDPACPVLEEVVASLEINSILFARPAEPYRSIMNLLVRPSDTTIYPEDSETRTFIHDIPVSAGFTPKAIVEALRRRKGLVIPHHGIVTFGTVSPEQAFITYSSICFACFVKFLTDRLLATRRTAEEMDALDGAITATRTFLKRASETQLVEGPFDTAQRVIEAMIQAGEATVSGRLVDSFFGNISYRLGQTVFISQTTSSLDELAGCIDACPLDGSSCVGLTASSEYSAHSDILTQTGNLAILHGHPKFSVILSMLCDDRECPGRGRCHLECPRERSVSDIPIIPGEVGTGRYGLSRTLPPAIADHRGAIVYGHGLFTVGRKDFQDAFANLIDIEATCLDEYLSRL